MVNSIEPTFMTIKQFLYYYPVFSGIIKNLIKNSNNNGLSTSLLIIPVGKRNKIYIDVTQFFNWLEKYRQQPRQLDLVLIFIIILRKEKITMRKVKVDKLENDNLHQGYYFLKYDFKGGIDEQ